MDDHPEGQVGDLQGDADPHHRRVRPVQLRQDHAGRVPDRTARGAPARSPSRPVPLAALPEAAGTGTSGTATLNPTPGYTGTLTAAVSGMAASAVTDMAFTATNTNFNTAAPAESDSVKKVTVTVPAGSALARFATYDDQAPAGTDSDMFVYRAGTNQLVGQSAGGTNEEIVTTTDGGQLRHLRRDVRAQHANAAGRQVPRIRGSWHGVGQPDRDSGQPGGDDGRSRHGHAGLVRPDAGSRYLGVIAFDDGTTALARTVVTPLQVRSRSSTSPLVVQRRGATRASPPPSEPPGILAARDRI